jgi:hypothetical protein
VGELPRPLELCTYSAILTGAQRRSALRLEAIRILMHKQWCGGSSRYASVSAQPHGLPARGAGAHRQQGNGTKGSGGAKSTEGPPTTG